MDKVEAKQRDSQKKSVGLTDSQATEETIHRESFEEHFLALAFQSKNWPYLSKRNVTGLVKTPRYVRILEVLKDYFKKYKRLPEV